MSYTTIGSNRTITLLSGEEKVATSEWFRLPKDKVFSVSGITTATVLIEYKTHEDQSATTLETFTADGDKANSDTLGFVRARISAYTSGTISVYCSIAE
jgi:hypothetical protein